MNERREVILRSNCFKLLAGCFYEPDRELLIEEQVCENLGAMLEEIAPEAALAARSMAAALREETPERLSVDHAALFVGPFALIAAPYGSVYMDTGRRVMGDSTLTVLRCYQEAGLSVEVTEPPDHVVIELEFLYYLANLEARALAEDRAAETAEFRARQAAFFSTCLRPWIFDFCRLVKTGAATSFYQDLSDCLAGFIAACEEAYALPAAPAEEASRRTGCCHS